MNPRHKKILSLLLAVVSLVICGQLEKSLNHDRDTLGLTYSEPLQNAPPVLALTTQALGGFRGLISNFLWIRADDLRLNDQYFEAAQLANWITDLEPHFTQVWIYEGWDMAYNISVKFKDFPDRWRWVQDGIALLRDRGLAYNPNDILIYRELAWFYQHKVGQNLDDANNYYKTAWAREMMPFFGSHGTNYDALINPRTPQDRTNAMVLLVKYKMNPVFIKQVDQQWGPLDWRTAEASSIYWGALGLEKAKEYPDKVVPDDIITVRRIIYQSMLQAFQHGQIIDNPYITDIETGPNLALIDKVNSAYLTMMQEEPSQADHIATGHRNFVCDAIYYLYEDNRMAEAQKWYTYLSKTYPDKTILDGQPTSFPRNLTLDQFAFGRVQGDVGDTSHDNTTEAIEGMLINHYEDIALGDDDRSTIALLLAHKIWSNYEDKVLKYPSDKGRTGLASFNDINKAILDGMLDPQHGLPYAARAVIRSQLRMPREASQPSSGSITNFVAPEATYPPSTNAPATNSVAQ